MAFSPRDPAYEARVRESFGRQAFMATIGAELVRVEPGLVEIAFGHRADLTQQHGYLHAGVVAAVADSASGYAALTLTAPEAEVLAVEFKVNLLRPAKVGRFLARGRVVRPGRTLTVCRGVVVDPAAATAGGGGGDAGDGGDDVDEKPIASMLSTIIAVSGRGRPRR
ncbi:MAG: PaaI family thioesterase [Gemmatimonadota bacterium]